MSQQQDHQVRDTGTSSRFCREEDEICSNKATSGSSDLGDDDSRSVHTQPKSSECEPQQPTSKESEEDPQTTQANHSDPTGVEPRVPPVDSSSLIGLTLEPLLGILPTGRKRSLGEVLDDENPPQKDKLSAEIEQLAGGLPHDAFVSSSRTQDVAPADSHQQKRSKISRELSTPRVLPIAIGDSSMRSDERGDGPVERRSERIRVASRRGSPGTSD
ncbi:hypothetical protein GQX73_g5144 [Xylaria multiplex]|uniref:Uncharacterized protein n=1 Tax=Xylaria multiplex TaxID=323545 RepID=A0A7C8IS70_9PEZI|nr:hypothetical protein GQX73_g5144 [Xylaria multiplex]